MAAPPPSLRTAPRARASRPRDDSTIKAVLGPTNTGKTHLAIERLCAHSSGAIGFPLRLLAREAYDRVCAIKGESRVALITGEERIEPKDARWRLCTVEAMPTDADLAFVALDEAQLAADRERGHIYTDRLLHARGREETMLLGAATLEPLVRSLVPEAEITSRSRFSTLRHVGAQKLSRIPPRSAIVAFSAEQVYAVAEMLRRFRGGAAVVSFRGSTRHVWPFSGAQMRELHHRVTHLGVECDDSVAINDYNEYSLTIEQEASHDGIDRRRTSR